MNIRNNPEKKLGKENVVYKEFSLYDPLDHRHRDNIDTKPYI